MSKPRFIHDTAKFQDWGYIRDTELDKLIRVVDHHSEEEKQKCREDGTDPYQKRIDELLKLLNS